MKVSIIIPIHNAEEFLKRCLDSIISQTFLDFECVLVDDCSTDNSPKICDEYNKKDSRFKVIHNLKNEGSSLARKKGLENSCGNYILFIDSDDYVEQDILKKMYNKAVLENCDIVYCNYNIFNTQQNTNKYINIIDITKMDKSDVIKNLLTYKFPWVIWNKMIKREIFDNVTFPVLQNGEDLVICSQLLYNCSRIGHINSPLYHWFVNPNSISFANKKDKKKMIEFFENVKLVVIYLKKKYGKNVTKIQPELDNLINYLKIELMENGYFKKTFEMFNFRFIVSLMKHVIRKICKICKIIQ